MIDVRIVRPIWIVVGKDFKQQSVMKAHRNVKSVDSMSLLPKSKTDFVVKLTPDY